jgi:predicted Holliday junction resolvase-like endonuclease
MGIISILIIAIVFLVILIYVFYKIGISQGKSQKELEWQEKIPQMQRAVAEHQRAGIKGKVTEAFAPFLPGFPYKASECKFLGDPIDYLVFEGLDERDIKGVHFVEVKQGTSKLSKHQKQIKDLIDSLFSDKVSFKEFNFED